MKKERKKGRKERRKEGGEASRFLLWKLDILSSVYVFLKC